MFSSKDLFFTPVSGAYQVTNSLRFRSSASAYLSRTPGSAGNRKTWTWSGWVKRGDLSAGQGLFSAGADNNNRTYIILQTDNSFAVGTATGGVFTTFRISSALYRDPSAWYHFVVAFDTTQSTASNIIKIYVNGSQITSFSTSNNPTLNGDYDINNTVRHTIQANAGLTTYFDGYLAEVNFIDGQALTPSSFGAYDTNGVWQPIACTVSDYGKNGFYLPFSDSANIFNDKAAIATNHSAANNWTNNNLQVATSTATTYDYMIDSPTNYADGGNGRGNYAVLNPLSFNSSNVVDGNLAYLGANLTSTRASFAMPTSGKWYWELTPVNASPNYVGFGLMGTGTTGATNFGNVAAGSWGIYPTTNMFLSINGSSVATGIATPALGVVFAAAYDAGTGNFWIGYSSSGSGSPTWFNSTGGTTGNPATGANPMATISAQTLFPAVSGNNTTADKSAINFGQRPFALTVPSGYSSLNTQNLTTPTITNGAQYMAAVTYTGTGSSQTITASSTNSGNNPNGTTFQPDFVWVKGRSGATDHALYDAVRGVQKQIESNTTTAETTETTGLTAFTSSGFTTGALAQMNTNTATYVAWEWSANGAGVSNTSGSITSTVSANQTAGFSVVTYTGNGTSGATVGHGLGPATPSMIIFKNRSNGAINWVVYHISVGNTTALALNLTNATLSPSTAYFNNTSPDSSKFTVGNGSTVNTSTENYVAYCFAPVAGYSAFGSYTGNGSADGPFVYLGFRPRWVMIKDTTSAGTWWLGDSSRATYNVVAASLFPNTSGAESSTYNECDFLSNGFKWRADNANSWPNNVSGNTYIYAAFAENPFKISRAR